MIELKRATPDAVRYACLNFHYAKRIPVAQYAYNVYAGGAWCGTIIYGCGAQHSIATAIGFDHGEVLELERVALNGKQQCTSEAVAASMKRLHREAPHVKALVSYADANQGHVGTIYQATNWIYIGDTSTTSRSKPDAYVIKGKPIHPRSVNAMGWHQNLQWLRDHVDPNASEVWGKPKFKYIYVFDKRLRKEWLKKALPYPKKTEQGS